MKGIAPSGRASRARPTAYPVRTAERDNLMLHAAIYHAAPGDVVKHRARVENTVRAHGYLA